MFRVPLPPEGITHAWYRFYAFVRPEVLATVWSRDRLAAEIAAPGFQGSIGSCFWIYREDTFARRRIGPEKPLPVAQELGETSLAFLTDPTWTHERTAELAEFLRDLGNRAAARTDTMARA